MLTKIELGGALGRLFGKVHHRAVNTTAEAVRALCVTLPGFEKYLNTSKSRGMTFAVFRHRKNVGVDDLQYPHNGQTIRIMPLIIGSKRSGLFQTILGAVLVTVGVVVGVMSGGTLSAVGYGVAKIGGAMMLGGVVQLLSPQTAGLASKQDADNQASYAFGSVTNTAAQGYPVPIYYGKRRIGGAIISAGIYAEDQQ